MLKMITFGILQFHPFFDHCLDSNKRPKQPNFGPICPTVAWSAWFDPMCHSKQPCSKKCSGEQKKLVNNQLPHGPYQTNFAVKSVWMNIKRCWISYYPCQTNLAVKSVRVNKKSWWITTYPLPNKLCSKKCSDEHKKLVNILLPHTIQILQ